MYIYPAIDLVDGRVVRLRQGDYGDMTVYGDDPAQTARSFHREGAKRLHIVDLDAAGDGGLRNLNIIKDIASKGDMFIEVGGGARDAETVKKYIDIGVNRVIIGSMAIERPEIMISLANKYPGRIAAGIDAKDGYVAIHGWRVVTKVKAYEFISSLPSMGIDTVIYTDISRDGMLKGPNMEAYEKLCVIKGLNVIASGGISRINDIERLTRLKLHGAIIGKALYDGGIKLSDALLAAKETVL